LGCLLAGVPRTLHTSEQEALAALLRSVRKEAGIQQAELARRLGRPQSFVSKIESGDRRVDLVELSHFCAAVGVPLGGVVARFEAAITTSGRGRSARTRR
jgi:transcriptional regulator with XRE-family HTH domain